MCNQSSPEGFFIIYLMVDGCPVPGFRSENHWLPYFNKFTGMVHPAKTDYGKVLEYHPCAGTKLESQLIKIKFI